MKKFVGKKIRHQESFFADRFFTDKVQQNLISAFIVLEWVHGHSL